MQFWGNFFMLKYALRNLEGPVLIWLLEKICSNYSYTKSLGHIVPILNRVEEKNVWKSYVLQKDLYCEKNISKNDEVTDGCQ